MTHTHDTTNPASQVLDENPFTPVDPRVNQDRRLFLLGRIEQVLHTENLQAPDDFFEDFPHDPLDMLAGFFAQFGRHDFRQLSRGDSELVEDWLLFRCGLSPDDRPMPLTIPQHVAALTKGGRA